LDEFLLAVAGIRLGTFDGTYSYLQEYNLVQVAWQQYRQQQAAKPAPKMGQAMIDGNYAASSGLAFGDGAVASFAWVDTTTGLPDTGPAIVGVHYDVNLDPNNPNVYVSLGDSFDSGSNYSFPFTMTGPYEPVIRATPFDGGGPIVILGVDDFNIAQGFAVGLVPEPASWLLLGMGVSVVAFVRRRKFPARE
jgi:hypothetical protein